MSSFFWTITPDEQWHWGGYDTREAALAEGRCEHPGKTIFTGTSSNADARAMMPDGDDLIDHMRNQSGDYGDEDGDWLAYISKEAKAELGERVQAVILKWLEEAEELPTFGLIEEIQEHAPEATQAQA